MPDEKILKSLVKTSEKLFLLEVKLNKGEFGEGDKLFRGADIMVLMPGSPLEKQKDHWLDNDVRIITPYAKGEGFASNENGIIDERINEIKTKLT